MLEFEKDIWRSQNDTPPVATKIGTPALLEQLGEECAELGKAALKEARRLRGKTLHLSRRQKPVQIWRKKRRMF